MISSNLKIAIRQLRKNRLFSFLNIVGLAVGLAAAMLIGLWVRDELSFDRHHANANRIFRVNFDVRLNGAEEKMAVAPAPMGPACAAEFPAVEAQCRFRDMGFLSVKVKSDEMAIEEQSHVYADASLFDVFSVPLVEGDSKTALREPNSLILTEKAARKYFGTTTGVVGKSLIINEFRPFRVDAVMKDWPSQSHFRFDFLLSMAGLEDAKNQVWLSNNYQTYLLLRPGVTGADFAVRFKDLEKKYIAPQVLQFTGNSVEDFEKRGDFVRYSLQPLTEIHLKSDRVAELGANSDSKYVWIFGSVALIVLLLACVNFMNLSTARSASRAREVGVRKALGSNRGSLVRQFLTESLVLTVVSFALAVGLVWLILPFFNSFSAKNISFSWFDGSLLVGLGCLAGLTALLAGIWPAFFLSAFRPIEAMKNSLLTNSKTGGGRLRSGLVVFQFFTSVGLISAVLIVQKQLDFIRSKKVGWEKEQLVMLRNTWWLRGQTLDFKNRLGEIPGIEAVTAADYFPTPSPRNSTTFNPAGGDFASTSKNCQSWEVDFDYLKTLGMKMKTGRPFDSNLKTDSMSCILNESAARAFGWIDPIGKKIETFSDRELKNKVAFEVVGMVEDFNFESLRQQIGPVILTIGQSSGTMAFRLSKSADIEKTMASVEQLYHEALPGKPFEFRFFDEEFDRQYRAEQRIGKILGAFAGFAVFIACLGLFGLAAFMAERRTKEIGVRKVLGASVGSLVGLLSKDFLKLVGIALLFAVPAAWIFMNSWLDDFAFRIKIGPEIFIAAGLVAVGLAFLTVSFQAIKAALADPVKSLRSE